MKNVSSMKSSAKTESPKTPGGISKSLLTPCRRVGLSRSWRKSGSSPFISPLSSSQNTINEIQTEKVPRKRKKVSQHKESDEEIVDETETLTLLQNTTSETEESTKTPTRSNLNRKRSKTLILAKESQESEGSTTENVENFENNVRNDLNINKVSKLSRQPTKSKIDKNRLDLIENMDKERNEVELKRELHEKNSLNNELVDTNKKSPQKLTTECIVVIQKGLINKDYNIEQLKQRECEVNKPCQASLDSDSDDIPLCQINKGQDVSSRIKKVAKLEDKKTSTTDLKVVLKKTKLVRKKSNKGCKSSQESNTEIITKLETKTLSQGFNPFDDDDDDFDHKKTIIIRKSYDKVKQPSKAKSTGSITDKDIEELKGRIEAKKKLLMVKALGSETEDLRELIKKWQKGCQDALVELMELMKKKMPDQPNIDNIQMLQMLKIPQDLVGYDPENDCFNSPSDTNIVLSSLKI